MRSSGWLLLAMALALRGAAAESPPRQLTLQQAQQIALTQHPRVSVASLTALAARQSAKAVQSAFFPNIYGSATAVGTADPNNTRIGAGALNNPLIYDREADGVTISQLITDFGRTWRRRGNRFYWKSTTPTFPVWPLNQC
jgi:outer membrane protein